MRKKSLTIIIILVFIICILSSCTSTNDRSVEENNIHKLFIDDGIDEIVLPDPADAKNDLRLTMPFVCNNRSDSDLDSKVKLTNLPFKDFSSDLLINNYNLGYLNSRDSTSFTVYYNDEESNQNNESKKGNAIVISATDPNDGQNYLITMDYMNDKYYFTKTALPWTDSICPAVDLVDLTGDGKHEIVTYVSSDDYKDGINYEVYRVENDSLKKIHSNIDNEEKYFSGHLGDDYTATIKYDDIGFEEIIILTDVGYRMVDFEFDDAPDNQEEDETAELRLFENGKYVGKPEQNLICNGKPLKELKVNYRKNEGKYILELEYPLYMGDWKGIGSALLWFGYDQNEDSLKASGAYYKYIGNYAGHQLVTGT